MKVTYGPPSEESKIIQKALQDAVAAALEKKRKLGQYAVFWDGEKPIAIGEDAPSEVGNK